MTKHPVEGLSVVILLGNLQDKFEQTLELVSFANEIIVVVDLDRVPKDKFPTSPKYKVFYRHVNNDFSQQRNFAASLTAYDWVLYIDSDEVVTPDLRSEIIKALWQPNHQAYAFKRQDIFMGKTLKHGETAQVRLVRLARKSLGQWVRPVHEYWKVEGRVGQLNSPILHRPHESLSSFLEKINYYTDLETQQRMPSNRLWVELTIYPPGKFLVNYLIRLGFLDGVPGLTMALMMSLHSLLVRIKLYEKTMSHDQSSI